MATQPQTLAFRKLPPEVREMIYDYCLDIEKFHFRKSILGYTKEKFQVKRIPLFLVALRGEKEIYIDALEFLYRKPTTEISFATIKSFTESQDF